MPFEGWDEGDTARQLLFTGLLAADWHQTRNMKDGYYETNLILGEHPSDGAVDLYMFGVAVGHALVSGFLKEGYRDAWQYIWVGAEAYTVYHNEKIGM